MKELFYKLKDRILEKYFPLSIEKYTNITLNNSCEGNNEVKQYFTARPNPGAGIGHQFANWTAGYWFAKFFKLNYAYFPFSNSHIPYSSSSWDEFFGFGYHEISVEELIKKYKYKLVRLPEFDEQNALQIERIKKIISSYSGKKIVFLAAQDQFYFKQYDLIPMLQNKFYTALAREKDNCIYDQRYCNIAIHVRRGDIIQKDSNKNTQNLKMRYQNNQYYINVLKNALSKLPTAKEPRIFLFSQGKEEDFEDFNIFENIRFCLEMNAADSFLHFVYADILITSKSSFSYKAALLNCGLKYSPKEFWHGYPPDSKWILADDCGNI
jgi:hypothetical protein